VLEHDLVDCFPRLPLLENIPFILTYANIAQAQPGDAQLQLLCAQKPNQYSKIIGAQSVLMVLSKSPKSILVHLRGMLKCAVQWYHHALSHVGQHRLIDTMSLTFYNQLLHKFVESAL
jgi:hypothetical protein